MSDGFLAWVAAKSFRYVFPYSSLQLRSAFEAAYDNGLVAWSHGSQTRFCITDKGRSFLPGGGVTIPYIG